MLKKQIKHEKEKLNSEKKKHWNHKKWHISKELVCVSSEAFSLLNGKVSYSPMWQVLSLNIQC